MGSQAELPTPPDAYRLQVWPRYRYSAAMLVCHVAVTILAL